MRFRLSEDPHSLGGLNLDSRDIAKPQSSEFDGLKRAFDILIAATALIVFSPIIFVFAVLIRLQDGGTSFFSQTRYGLGGETFQCYKLRSMSMDAAERLEKLLKTDPEARREWQATQKLRNDPRITALGHFVRKSSIDELPQLWNVLKGEMSIVGPRPIVENEIQHYGDDFRFYKAVRPGLTGLWQVEGRSDTTYQERVEMDVSYVQTRSFWKDVSIVLRTIPAVLKSRGAV